MIYDFGLAAKRLGPFRGSSPLRDARDGLFFEKVATTNTHTSRRCAPRLQGGSGPSSWSSPWTDGDRRQTFMATPYNQLPQVPHPVDTDSSTC